MDSQFFWIILLLDVFHAYGVENMDNKLVQPKRQMSKERASETCARTGGSLVNYASIKATPSAPGYVSQLVDGDSAWINGFAKLSPFLAWHGCFNRNQMRQYASIYTSAIENKSLYLCSQLCLLRYSSETMYIGVKSRQCYCINHQQGQAIHNAAVNDSLCSLPCENNIFDSCGGHSFVSVYSIVETRSVHWAQNEPSKRQCMYAKKRTTGLELHTASCHTLQALSINGYICMNSVSSGSAVTSTCSKNYKTGAFCIVAIPTSRQEAFTNCMERRGKLADLSSESVVWPKMITNFKYWISVYRTFGISERYIENKTICLAAVRVNNTLYLEPDDCSEEKHYLCELETISHSNQYPNITFNTGTVITIPTTTGGISITTPDTGYVSPFAYIIPGILIVIFLVIIVVFVLQRRRKKHMKHHKYISDDTYTAIYETDNLENEQTSSAVSSVQGQNGDSKYLIAKSKPDESIRQTQEAKAEESKGRVKKKCKEMQDEDYDKIDFKQSGNVRKDAYEETNVYNHVLDTTDNNYDTTDAIKSLQSVGPCESDDTYSHMKDGVSVDKYCGLLEAGKKQTGHGKDNGVSNDYCCSEDVGQMVSPLATDKLPRFVIVDDNQDDGKNDSDIVETAHNDEPVTYTEILNFGAENKTEYTCSEKFDKADRNIDNR